jgi:hypothetical protein
MPSDRVTAAPRPAGGGGAGQQSPWPEPTAPAARRLPGAPRERRPALAALAVLLILGGALGAGFLVLQSGQRVTAVEVAAPVGAGQHIPASALRPVQIASGTGLSYVPWDQAAQITRFFTVSAIPPGTLLTRSMVAATGGSLAGQAVLGLALKDGQLPRGLQPGDHVDIYQVSDAQEMCPGGAGAVLAAGAVVLSVAAPAAVSGSSAQADVEVALSPADAGVVACNAANGLVGLAVLPGGATGTSATGTVPPASAAAAAVAGTGRPARAGARRRGHLRPGGSAPGGSTAGRAAGTGATPTPSGTASPPPGASASPAASTGPSPGGTG